MWYTAFKQCVKVLTISQLNRCQIFTHMFLRLYFTSLRRSPQSLEIRRRKDGCYMKLIYAIIRYDNEDDVTTSLTNSVWHVFLLPVDSWKKVIQLWWSLLSRNVSTRLSILLRRNAAITRRSPSICHMYPVPQWFIVQPCRCLSMWEEQRSSLWMLSGMKRSDNRK